MSPKMSRSTPRWESSRERKAAFAAASRAFMAHNIVIRSALPTDAVAYRELRLEALRNHPTAFSASYDEQVTFPDEFWQERINSNIDSPNNVIFFAVSDET